MARLIPVPDPADPRLADYVRLRDVNLRKSLEAEHGLFVAEGEKVIRRAVAAGHPVRSLLMARRWAEPLADVLDGLDGPAYIVDDATMEALTGFQVHRGALASLERLPLPPLEAVLAGARRILVLEDLVDHANVGSIYRCAAALGIDAIVLSPRCADPLYRRSVKVSMGAVFAIPYMRLANWRGGLGEVRAAGFTLLALTPDQAATPIDEASTGDRVALMLGSEGDGLSSHWLDEADEPVCIPMSPDAMTAGVDSLNVTAAAAIACHSLMHKSASGKR
ncbi:TrmH family RNA methyltransferase [Actinomadura madurae]|uniref:TrmH family RNA methyltransferase n=1 Tax=Actinomadura madurae TaxID=1993 RepID=UPI00202671C2|nr:RNA methyltransferase [Actinomadura madurae]MCQ0009305.1 RNA methyltransferase [Actinomadura madurae]URM95496.1 RNA methyltransferase [Actinomadura madurae]